MIYQADLYEATDTRLTCDADDYDISAIVDAIIAASPAEWQSMTIEGVFEALGDERLWEIEEAGCTHVSGPVTFTP